MGAGHSHPLHLPGDSPLHRAPVEVKIVAAFVGVAAVVATPPEQYWAFGVFALLLVAVWRVGEIPLRWILPRSVIELPFVVLAVLLPFSEGGPQVEVLGLTLSQPGTVAAWGIVAKGTLGVLTSITLAATTEPRELPVGLQKLRVPSLVTTIVVLMLRYVDLLVDEGHRMRLARLSRGDDPRTWRQLGATARGVGGLFLRAYERGERVHLAMASRGFTGTMPTMTDRVTTSRSWAAGALPAGAAVLVAGSALLLA